MISLKALTSLLLSFFFAWMPELIDFPLPMSSYFKYFHGAGGTPIILQLPRVIVGLKRKGKLK